MFVGIVLAMFLMQPPEAVLPQILVYSHTAGFRHDSIPQGQALIRSLAGDRWAVECTEDPSRINADTLAAVDVLVLLQATGDCLPDASEDAVAMYLQAGGGLVGIHAAADSERDWPFFGKHVLGGAWFESHPRIQEATVVIEDPGHPAMQHLEKRWTRVDEWYNFAASPRGTMHVLASLDESSYEGGAMGADHPIVWCGLVGDGAVFYTGLGHTRASYAEEEFQRHLEGAITWALDQGWTPIDRWRHRDGWQDAGEVEAIGRHLQLEAGQGVMANGTEGQAGDLVTADSYGDCELHVEFLIPKGSNSGVYLQGRYEVQILDSHGNPSPGSGDCGGIYERWDDARSPKGFEGTPPNQNASKPAGAWQTFDIVFRAPRFDADGQKVANAVLESVRHNGVLIHEQVTLTGPTRGGWGEEAPTGPLRFQGDHGPVAFRGLRIRTGGANDQSK